jgi:hypothetical protein
MNCTQLREILPAYIYGDLEAARKQAVDDHLAICPLCREERAALADIKRTLDLSAVPLVDVDVRQICAEANRRQRMQMRRWRRVAWLAAGAAAALLLAFVVRFEARWEGRQLVVRFGLPPAEVAVSRPTVVAEKQLAPPPAPEVTAADLRLLKDLVHTLAATIEQRDGKFQENLAQLEFEVNQVQEQARTRWAATERYVSALYTSQMDSHTKGER